MGTSGCAGGTGGRLLCLSSGRLLTMNSVCGGGLSSGLLHHGMDHHRSMGRGRSDGGGGILLGLPGASPRSGTRAPRPTNMGMGPHHVEGTSRGELRGGSSGRWLGGPFRGRCAAHGIGGICSGWGRRGKG